MPLNAGLVEASGITSSDITRRDFVKGTLIGSGAVLLTMPAPIMAETRPGDAVARLDAETVHPWDGYAGVGDYARSNGNTESTTSAAHLIRDNKIGDLQSDAQLTPVNHTILSSSAVVLPACQPHALS